MAAFGPLFGMFNYLTSTVTNSLWFPPPNNRQHVCVFECLYVCGRAPIHFSDLFPDQLPTARSGLLHR